MPTTNRSAVLATVAALVLIPGCGLPWHDPGGSQASYDEHTYISTPDSPKTIKVVDWTTNTTLWSIDLPIGHQVTIRFFEDFDPKNRERPDLMRWEVWDHPDLYGQLHSSMPVPDKDHRKIVWDNMTRPAAPTPENAGTPPPGTAPAR